MLKKNDMFSGVSILFAAISAWFCRDLMDGYAWGVFVLFVGVHFLIMHYWPKWFMYSLSVFILSTLSIFLYQNDLERGSYVFLLKYILSSQASLMWMMVLAWLASLILNGAWMTKRSEFYRFGYALYWAAAVLGWVALMVRWRESYLISWDVGHIPVSNLYEVFIMFSVMMMLMLLYYQEKFDMPSAGAPVSWVISIVLGFMLWYMLARDAQVIQPLIPALQSWWMKIHVPANFIGYGAFSIASMLGIYYLIYPSEKIEQWMYQIIVLGFLFFTIATLLGAMWAAEAWGSYWSWDPKETWALIVWLNYAAWLHIRLVKGWNGSVLAWWSIIGFFLTAFAFLGVNLWLAGLHSYGGL
jgi:ABC-type transport system involved in cytochrome c biogenesis permease subunit